MCYDAIVAAFIFASNRNASGSFYFKTNKNHFEFVEIGVHNLNTNKH
jgi:hypothetical protein